MLNIELQHYTQPLIIDLVYMQDLLELMMNFFGYQMVLHKQMRLMLVQKQEHIQLVIYYKSHQIQKIITYFLVRITHGKTLQLLVKQQQEHQLMLLLVVHKYQLVMDMIMDFITILIRHQQVFTILVKIVLLLEQQQHKEIQIVEMELQIFIIHRRVDFLP